MSTIFVLIKEKIIPTLTEFGELKNMSDDDYIEIAIRGNKGYISWKNNFDIIAPYIFPNTRVYPIDNTPQGIFTIEDLINEYKKSN